MADHLLIARVLLSELAPNNAFMTISFLTGD